MSTLLADTIRKTGGTAGVDIRVKNNSVYETDGGTSVTQNMVQSLSKQWVYFNYASTTAVESMTAVGSNSLSGALEGAANGAVAVGKSALSALTSGTYRHCPISADLKSLGVIF